MWKDSVTIGNRNIELETGRIARQAHGAVLLREGDTAILSTVVYDPKRGQELDFLPLTVDYRVYMSAAGRIPGGFLRREGRSSDAEVLGSRLCDRSIRPLFPKSYAADTQVISTVLSYQTGSDTTVLAMNGAAAALHLSEIPWQGPLAALRVGRVDKRLIALPTLEELGDSDLDLVVSCSLEGVVMIEGGGLQVPEGEMLEAIAFAQEHARPMLELMEKLRGEVGREKVELPPPPEPPAFAVRLEEEARGPLTSALDTAEKHARRDNLREAKQAVIDALESAHPDAGVAEAAPGLLDELEARLMREQIVKEKRRVDGRAPDAVRPVSCEVDWLPSPHGAALFTRGETQAMVTLTLGTSQDRQLVESLDGVGYERFMLHYAFPPYSVGETRPLRGPGRREVGHGTLARRALAAVLPSEEAFPYTLRIASEISESNGSSSMATVCGGCLALMDGGVPITAPVAGIAMGMVQEDGEIVILSDILGDEDHLGDMDFKVAGSETGITAIQMDNKIGSLPAEVMAQAFEQARQGRLHILAEMAKAIAQPREAVKPHVPLITTLHIAPDRIRDLIGPGGKIIQKIQRDTSSRLEVDDEGAVRIYAPNKEACDAAEAAVLNAAGSLEVGQVYLGVVTGVKDFGAFVRIRGSEGLVHISEWAPERTENLPALVKLGDEVRVKVLEPDKPGRLSLSRKAAL
ncbi:MAG: polyribonucleotide nucleotidyltransferase [SAR324 cluster bacterium]|nr:polyribonucleotide nucleotidyltransferase [SAR324 cluster bacterium]